MVKRIADKLVDKQRDWQIHLQMAKDDKMAKLIDNLVDKQMATRLTDNCIKQIKGTVMHMKSAQTRRYTPDL